MKYLGQGLFFATEIDSTNPSTNTHRNRIFNHAGNRVQVSVPNNITIDEVFLPAGSETKDVIARALPDETMIRIHGPRGFGLCSSHGKVIVEPNFGTITPLSGRYYQVYEAGGGGREFLSFVIDTATGSRVVAPANCRITSSSGNDIVPFEQLKDIGRHGPYGYMLRTGQIVVQPRFAFAGEFSADGLARVVEVGQKDGVYIDRNGHIVSRPFFNAGDFKNGLAVAGIGKWPERRAGLINTRFEFVLPQRYYDLTPLFPEIYAARTEPNGRFSAISPTGKVLFKFPAEVVGVSPPIGENILCTARNPQGSDFGRLIIDKNGKIVTPYESLDEGTSTRWTESRVSPDRKIKCVQGNRFYPESFQQPGKFGSSNRFDAFSDFLHCYNVIGMPRRQLHSLLGADARNYNMTFRRCGGPGGVSSLEFEYKDDKVSGWRFVTYMINMPGRKTEYSPWYRQNMEVEWPVSIRWQNPEPLKLKLKV